MNTIQIQLNDKQLSDLVTLLDIAHADLQSDMDNVVDDETAVDTQSLLEAYESIHDALVNRSYLWSSSCGRIELEIAARHVEAIAVPGDNEPACLAAIENDGYLRTQLERMDMEKARGYLKDAGIGEVENDEIVRIYILWIAAWDIHEERNMED